VTENSQPGTLRRALGRLEDRLGRRAGGTVRAGASDALLLRRTRWRLVAWSGVATLVVLAVLGSVLYFAVAQSLASTSRETLQTRADMIERFITDPRSPRSDPQRFGLLLGGPASGTYGYLVTPSGTSVGPPVLGSVGLPDAGSVSAARAGGVDVRAVSLNGTPFRVLSEPVGGPDGTYVIQTAVDTTNEQHTLVVLVEVLLLGGLLAIIGASAVGAIYAQRALVPIRESLRRQREFAADASHEFRTPLAVIRSSVEHLERHKDEPVRQVGDALHDIDDEVEHLTALVGDLLLLARTDSGVVELERHPLDLADVAGEALASVSPLAARHAVRVVLDPEPATVVGDPLRLRQLITILADNAIAHSPAGATVTVNVRRVRNEARLRVDDQGPGIAANDIPRVFDRFWRGPNAPEGGTGLGLAIAAWIVEHHGGTIAADNRPEGGARFEVSLPVAAA
jgi:two-component system, OmpR family, sensor histidine kinase CiaH